MNRQLSSLALALLGLGATTTTLRAATVVKATFVFTAALPAASLLFVQGTRMGKSVSLAVFSTHLGG